MAEDPTGVDREEHGGDDGVGEEELPGSIDAQPEDPDYPGRESPEPLD